MKEVVSNKQKRIKGQLISYNVNGCGGIVGVFEKVLYKWFLEQIDQSLFNRKPGIGSDTSKVEDHIRDRMGVLTESVIETVNATLRVENIKKDKKYIHTKGE